MRWTLDSGLRWNDGGAECALGPGAMTLKLDYAFLDAFRHGLQTAIDTQLVEDADDVGFHGALADLELVGNLFVGRTCRHDLQHFNLPDGK